MSFEPRPRAPVGEPVDAQSLRRLLFRDAVRHESPADVIRWWETRRLGYNAVVGSVGLLSVATIAALGAIGPSAHGLLLPPLAIVAYGVLANVFYTLGWITELALLRPLFGRKSAVVGATLFRYGLAFATGMTLLPNLVASIDLGVRIVRWVASTM